jgi:hypothetical protein
MSAFAVLQLEGTTSGIAYPQLIVKEFFFPSVYPRIRNHIFLIHKCCSTSAYRHIRNQIFSAVWKVKRKVIAQLHVRTNAFNCGSEDQKNLRNASADLQNWTLANLSYSRSGFIFLGIRIWKQENKLNLNRSKSLPGRELRKWGSPILKAPNCVSATYFGLHQSATLRKCGLKFHMHTSDL